VYAELRTLAAAKLANETPGQTLQAMALVQEAYLRLLGGENEPQWNSRGHFFAAAAEAMRRILIEAEHWLLTERKQTACCHRRGGLRGQIASRSGGGADGRPADDALRLTSTLCFDALLQSNVD